MGLHRKLKCAQIVYYSLVEERTELWIIHRLFLWMIHRRDSITWNRHILFCTYLSFFKRFSQYITFWRSQNVFEFSTVILFITFRKIVILRSICGSSGISVIIFTKKRKSFCSFFGILGFSKPGKVEQSVQFG